MKEILFIVYYLQTELRSKLLFTILANVPIAFLYTSLKGIRVLLFEAERKSFVRLFVWRCEFTLQVYIKYLIEAGYTE